MPTSKTIDVMLIDLPRNEQVFVKQWCELIFPPSAAYETEDKKKQDFTIDFCQGIQPLIHFYKLSDIKDQARAWLYDAGSKDDLCNKGVKCIGNKLCS